MPPRPRRVAAGAALLLVLGGVLGVYRSPASRHDRVTPDLPQPVAARATPEAPQPAGAPATARHASVASWPDERVQADGLHTNVFVDDRPSLVSREAEPDSTPLERQKPETPCDKQSRLHESCSMCRSGSPGDGGVEAMGGLCREHCSRQGSGYCGEGDEYVSNGLDCRPCRRWLPGADAVQSSGTQTGAKAAVPHGDGRVPMLLADDRIDAVCFQPATVVDSLSGVGSCIGGDPCPNFASLAMAQATCSRDTRCSAVVLSVDDASGSRFELYSAQPELSTLPEHDIIPDTVLWRVTDSCDDNAKATPGPQSSSLPSSADLYITVKTSAARGNHARRPLALLRSWANTRSVREHTFFFTDAAERDPTLLAMSGGESHWIDTGCGSARGRSLCCKTDAELRGFVAWADAHITGQGVRWWCHLDDDNYVLLGPLRQFLSELRQPDTVPYYVGRAGPTKSGNRLHAPFAMGGAGYCLNEVAARLAAKGLNHDLGAPSAAGIGLRALCDEIDYPDDMALGVLMTQRLKPAVALTEDPLANARTGPRSWNGGFYGGRFHSQWEIYGQSLAQLMSPFISAQPMPGHQLTAMRRPHEQFVYGWDRQDKTKTSAPRDMMHLHYFLSVLSQAYGGVGGDSSSSACYGEPQHGPVTADGALERKLGSNGLMLAYQFGSVAAAMLGCNDLGDTCSVVAAVDIAGSGTGSKCAYVLFDTMPLGAGADGATGWQQGCGTAWAKLPATSPCLEPRIYGELG